jgi:hypothetical protein
MKRRIHWTGIACAGLIVLACAVYMLSRRAPASPPAAGSAQSAFGALPSEAPAFASSGGAKLPEGYAPYRSARYGFALGYPEVLSVREYDEGGGAGFQIFIVPYAEEQVSEARFLKDEPSGVREQAVFGLIDGATASAFYGRDLRLGDTYEVWFVHGGYLYEVTTLKPLDGWLQGIMQTWTFR